jgi:hypothetical protein
MTFKHLLTHIPRWRAPLALVLVLLASGCATTSKTESPAPELPKAPPLTGISSVEIQYTLGHSQNQLVLKSEKSEEGGMIQSYLEHQIVGEAKVDGAHYAEFYQKAVVFAQDPGRSVAQMDNCRNPFTITIRNEKENQVTNGCRSSDEGKLSRLVRAGETLLYTYSKK